MKKFAAAALLATLYAGTPAHASLNTGLLGYWSFNDCTAKDNSGHGYSGTLNDNGTASCVDSASDKGFQYQGAMDENIRINTFPELKQALTLSAFIQLDKTHISSLNPIITRGHSTEAYTLWASSQSIQLLLNWNSSAQHWCSAPVALQADTNYQVGATYDQSKSSVILYLNGRAVGNCSYSTELYSQSEPLYFSSSYPGAQEYLKGMIDEVRIYNRALSASEMLSLYYKVNPPVIKGTAPWATAHSVVCRNVTTGVEVTLPTTKSSAWDCEKAGLEVRSGDKVEVTISGKKF